MNHKENSIVITTPKPKIVSKDMGVFYNPIMKVNRDISIALVKVLKLKKIGDVLAATGIRGLRMAKELQGRDVHVNDNNPDAVTMIKKHAKANNVQITITCKDANEFLKQGFDYVDIDPFGSPNPFLDSAVKSVKNKGVLAVTATDTAPLSGTYPKACMRKYWALPKKDWMMHETGIRILIRKAQLIAAQYDKALTPIYCHSTNHYFRVYLRCDKGKTKVDALWKHHGMLHEAGPLWLGSLWDAPLAKKIAKHVNTNMTNIIAEESQIPVAGFFSTHHMAKGKKGRLPKIDTLLALLRKKHKASKTHFSGYGIRTTATRKEFDTLFNQARKK